MNRGAGAAEKIGPRLNDSETFMFSEAAESAEVVSRQIREQQAEFRRLGALLRKMAPRLVVTLARGSSDHAATYAKYLIETRARAVCASAAPSIASVYASRLPVENALCLAISQSGRSPDLVRSAQSLKASGAFVVALVNAPDSPLGALADATIPLCAGTERSVAATKSYIASLAAIAHLVARWTEDAALMAALRDLPDLLQKSWSADWREGAERLAVCKSAFVLGRGVGLGIAQEAALKLKETCGVHGEAFSAAEVLHGPAALVGPGFPVLAFSQNDQTLSGLKNTIETLARRGADVFCIGEPASFGVTLPAIDAHPALQPALAIQSFYRMANAVALRKGLDPDRPPNLNKITETI